MEVGNCCKRGCQAVKRQQGKTVQGGEKKLQPFQFCSLTLKVELDNGQFQCLANFLLKHEKQNQSPQLKRAYQKQ